MENNEIETIRQTAEQVAKGSAELADAIAQAEAAEAQLLERVIALVGPAALRAVSTRPEIAYEISGHADCNRQREETTHAEWRGLVVSCEPREVGPARFNSRDSSGAYGGSDLLLLPDGTFRELIYSGRWSNWQGSSWGWSSEARDLTCAEVAAEYEVDEILGHLRTALDRAAAGNAPKRAEQARQRAERVRALLALL